MGPYLRMSLWGKSYNYYGFLISAEETDGEVYSSRALLTKHWAALTSHEAARVPGLCSAVDLLRGGLLSSSGPFLSTKLKVEAAAKAFWV